MLYYVLVYNIGMWQMLWKTVELGRRFEESGPGEEIQYSTRWPEQTSLKR